MIIALSKQVLMQTISSPLSRSINTHIVLTVVHIIISYGTSWENLHKHRDILCLAIIPFILMSYMFDQVLIL